MNPNFIQEYKNSLPPVVCENLISLFEEREDLHVAGKTTEGLSVPAEIFPALAIPEVKVGVF